jgi:MFS family permease
MANRPVGPWSVPHLPDGDRISPERIAESCFADAGRRIRFRTRDCVVQADSRASVRCVPPDGFAAIKPLEQRNRTSRLPAGIWMLGVVSLFMDLSSEMITDCLPVFLVGTLGVSALTLGLIEGVAESTASIVKLFSGTLSDRFGKRKPLMLLGYGLAALTKPLFPLAGGAGTVFAARFIDRIGKGIRGAPRDAYVADVTPPEQRGAAYGLRQAMDTAGAFAGPLVAIGLMLLWHNDIRRVLWIAVIPAFIALLVLWLGVREPAATKPPARRVRIHWHCANGGASGKLLEAAGRCGVVYADAFLGGFPRAACAGCRARHRLCATGAGVMSGVYMLSAWPAGILSDRFPRLVILVVGCLVMLGADLVLAFGHNEAIVLVGIALWGLHMGLTEGLLAAYVADAAPSGLRGSAFGAMNLVRGVVLRLQCRGRCAVEYGGSRQRSVRARVMAF